MHDLLESIRIIQIQSRPSTRSITLTLSPLQYQSLECLAADSPQCTRQLACHILLQWPPAVYTEHEETEIQIPGQQVSIEGTALLRKCSHACVTRERHSQEMPSLPRPKTPKPSPEHDKTSKATEANQDNEMNKTNQGLPKVMIDINTLRYTLLSPSS